MLRNWYTTDFPTIAPANIPFFEGKKIDGTSLEKNLDLATEIKSRIYHYNRAPKTFLGFPINSSSYLAMGDIQQLKKKPYLVSPKPQGERYLLYTDGRGRMFLDYGCDPRQWSGLDSEKCYRANLYYPGKTLIIIG